MRLEDWRDTVGIVTSKVGQQKGQEGQRRDRSSAQGEEPSHGLSSNAQKIGLSRLDSSVVLLSEQQMMDNIIVLHLFCEAKAEAAGIPRFSSWRGELKAVITWTLSLVSLVVYRSSFLQRQFHHFNAGR